MRRALRRLTALSMALCLAAILAQLLLALLSGGLGVLFLLSALFTATLLIPLTLQSVLHPEIRLSARASGCARCWGGSSSCRATPCWAVCAIHSSLRARRTPPLSAGCSAGGIAAARATRCLWRGMPCRRPTACWRALPRARRRRFRYLQQHAPPLRSALRRYRRLARRLDGLGAVISSLPIRAK